MTAYSPTIYRVTRKLTRRELPSETTDGFDYALDVVVERTEVGRWYPVLLMHRGANCSNRILAKELRLNLESQDIAGPSRRFVFRVPVAGDLCCVFFIRNRIKKRLLGQPRWESPETPLPRSIRIPAARQAGTRPSVPYIEGYIRTPHATASAAPAPTLRVQRCATGERLPA